MLRNGRFASSVSSPFPSKLLYILFLIVFLYLCSSSPDDAHAQVTLAWNASTSSGIAGYKIHYGTSSGNYSTVIDVGNATTYTTSSLQSGLTYYFAITDYDTAGDVSGYSNQVSYTVAQACTNSISPTSQSIGSAGGTGTVNVTAASGCSWTAVSNASWITITSNSSGSGNGTLNYSVSANSTSSSQTGTMTIAGQTFTVTQSAGASCSYTISPTSILFSSGGGAGTISVSSPSGCSWSATSNVSWLAITSGSSGSGSGTVAFSDASNSSTSSRTGTLTVAGKTFQVTQSGTRHRWW